MLIFVAFSVLCGGLCAVTAVCCVVQLFAKLQATKQEIQDLQEEHVGERQELEQTQNELTRELKLKSVLYTIHSVRDVPYREHCVR